MPLKTVAPVPVHSGNIGPILDWRYQKKLE